MSIEAKEIAHGGIHGYLAQPPATGKAGVLILPTICGVNPLARRYANGLAEVGLTAAVCDLYSGQPPVAGYEEAVKRARTLSDAPVEKIVGNWLDHLQADRQLTSLGILGFCLGGRYALLRAAHDHHINACAAAYPSIPDPMLANQQQDVLRLALWR